MATTHKSTSWRDWSNTQQLVDDLPLEKVTRLTLLHVMRHGWVAICGSIPAAVKILAASRASFKCYEVTIAATCHNPRGKRLLCSSDKAMTCQFKEGACEPFNNGTGCGWSLSLWKHSYKMYPGHISTNKTVLLTKPVWHSMCHRGLHWRERESAGRLPNSNIINILSVTKLNAWRWYQRSTYFLL